MPFAPSRPLLIAISVTPVVVAIVGGVTWVILSLANPNAPESPQPSGTALPAASAAAAVASPTTSDLPPAGSAAAAVVASRSTQA